METKIEGGILTVVLPETNESVITTAFLEELHKTVQYIYDRKEIQGSVFFGFFDANRPQKAFTERELLSEHTARKLAEQGQEIMSLIEDCHKPIIAAIHGNVLDELFEIVLACHIRIAAANASLGFSCIREGLIPGFGGIQRLPQLIGKSRALEMMMTGSPMYANRALETGLVNHLAESKEELKLKSLKVLEKIIRNPAFTIGMIIDCINTSYESKQSGLQAIANHFARCHRELIPSTTTASVLEDIEE